MKSDWNVNDKWTKFSIQLEQYRMETFFLRTNLKETKCKNFVWAENTGEIIAGNKFYKEAKIHLTWLKLHSFWNY